MESLERARVQTADGTGVLTLQAPRPRAIRVVLLEGHSVVRAAIRRTIETLPAIETVAETSTTNEALQAVKQYHPDVILLGIVLPCHDCFDFVDALRRQDEELGIVVLLAKPSPESVFWLMRQGVHGLLSERASEQDLDAALHAAAGGSSFVCRRIRELAASASRSMASRLTRQELRVLQLLMQGQSNREIARKLTLSEKTVETHLTHIYSKLNVYSRAEAIVRAQELNVSGHLWTELGGEPPQRLRANAWLA